MSTVAASLTRGDQRWTRRAQAYLGASVAVTVLYLVSASVVLAAVAFGTIAIGTVLAISTGLRVHQPRPRAPWVAVGAACVLFLVGGVLRALSGPDPVAAGAALVPALPTLAGYGAVAVALVGWLRSRAQPMARRLETTLDTTLVGVGATLAVWVLLLAPVLEQAGLAATGLGVSIAFPVIDAVLLTLLVHVAFTTAPGDRSFTLLALCLGFILLGDVGYAVNATTSTSLPTVLLDAPFLIGYGALGAAALHPSMAHVAAARPPVHYHPRRRLPILMGALLLVATALAAAPTHGPTDRVVRAVLLGLLLLGVLARSERAVRRHAAGEAAARHASTHDQLTGLPNRALLTTELTRLLHQPGPSRLSVLFLDLDGFKFVNDSYGHAVGDELLRAVADRLLLAVRPGDVLARHGGDEFIVGAPLERAAVRGLARRLIDVLTDPFELSVGPVVISTCVGLARATTTGHEVDLEELVREADAAMYHAKTLGRGEFAVYDDSLRQRAREQVETSTALRDALQRHEFEVYYQPIVDLHTGNTVGHEALLRWHRNGQLMSPAGFIPIAEASAIIVPIGAWVLDQALARVAHLRRTTPDLHVAVNVSARQLRGHDLLTAVTDLLTEHHLPGSALWLELTETALVQDVPTALSTLRALHDAGVVICVDDFGTAYSALSYLQTFPISVVKIDGSFVRALGQEPAQSSLVAAVQHMATDLGLRTVAEGVETAEQEQQLRDLGCRLVQGYRFGRPAPADPAAGPV